MSIDISKLADMEGQFVYVAGLMPGMKFGDAGVLKIDEDNTVVVHNFRVAIDAISAVKEFRDGVIVTLPGNVTIYVRNQESLEKLVAPEPQCVSPND